MGKNKIEYMLIARGVVMKLFHQVVNFYHGFLVLIIFVRQDGHTIFEEYFFQQNIETLDLSGSSTAIITSIL